MLAGRLGVGKLRDKNKPQGFVAHLDQVGPNYLRGWAASLDQPGHALGLRFYLDGKQVGEATASIQREDLRAAGYGEGRHAFHVPVPVKALFCAVDLEIRAVHQGREITILQTKLRQTARRGSPIIYLDASDLLEFLAGHREISGIQRVQVGYLLGLADAAAGDATCRICTRVKFHNWYFNIPRASFAALLRDKDDYAAIPEAAWSEHVQRFKESLSSRAEIQPGDAIFTLGAPWALDYHNEFTRCIRDHYGARYFQVFYDLIPISAPEVVPAPMIPPFARAMAAMATYANHIFSISNYAKDDLAATLRKLDRPVPSLSVVPMGASINDSETPIADERGGGAIDKVKGPFVLCVGTLEPRKNHMLLFRVWQRLVDKYGAENVPKLVLVGRVGWYMDDFLRMLRITSYVDKTIIHLTGISNLELETLYSTCLFTIFPSFSEGWGLPITESLAHGKVCVCSNTTSMPEAGGEHALYIDPFDTSAAFELCDTLIHDNDALRAKEEKIREGFNPAPWSKAAQGVCQELTNVMSRPFDAMTRRSLELGRAYHLYNIEPLQSNLTSTRVLRNYLDQEDAFGLLAGWNWFELDVNCTWACGRSADLSLVPPSEGPPDLVAYVEIVGFPTYQNAKCFVTVDGRAIGAFTLDSKAQQVVIDLPGTGHSAEILVGLEVKEERPRAGEDGRMVCFGVRSIVVFDAADLAGRIRMLEDAAVSRLVLEAHDQ